MISKDEMVKALRRAAADHHAEQAGATAKENWRAAFEARLTNLIWRTIALSLELGVAAPRFNPGTDPIVLARRLERDCEVALATMKPTQDKAGPFHKLTTISDVLRGTLDAVGVLEAWTGGDPQEPFFLAARAVALGQFEAELALAEDGHWEQVAKWKSQKVGRPPGSRASWRIESAPLIQSWIDADPTIRRPDLANKLNGWLNTNWRRLNQTRPSPPQLESLGNLLREMDADGLIRLNDVPKKSEKKRKS